MAPLRPTPLLVALLVAACGDSTVSRGAVRNVVLLTLDTTRADYLSCYGPHGLPTPNLDALAAEGTRFDLALSTASVTPVSHAAILTGRYNHSHGLRVLFAEGGYRLPAEVETLATVLDGHGFHTRAVHSAFPVSRFFGLERGFDEFQDLVTGFEAGQDEFHWDVAKFQRRSDATTDLVTRDLGDEPFFLWVHYWDPHDLAELPPGLELDPSKRGESSDLRQPFYAEEVQYVDAQIGRLVAALKERGLYDSTMIVVVADHGQGLMDHGWPGHRLLYQEHIRVPLIVRVPLVAPRAAVEELARTVDIYPTVLDYLGIAPPRAISGRSLRPLLEGRPDEPRLAFADQLNGLDWNAGQIRQRPLDDFLYAVVEREWKYVYRPMRPRKSELFHLASDPGELTDVSEQHPEVVRRLLGELAREAPWVSEPFAPLGGAGADVQATLSGLGYTGTDPVEAEWEWSCPEHRSERWPTRGPCPTCGSPPLLVGRRAEGR
ncbi:MAG: sulfatase [Planctomycetota bacterium]